MTKTIDTAALLPRLPLLLLILFLPSANGRDPLPSLLRTTVRDSQVQQQQRQLQNLESIKFPYWRFKLWSDLSNLQRQHAQSCGYIDESSWNWPSVNDIEYLSLETIGQTNVPCELSLLQLGFDERSWDCHVNHYGDYDWNELEERNLHIYYEGLGWNSNLWNNDGTVGSDEMFWEELSETERTMATQLCYTQELWDGLSFEEWTRPLPVSPAPTRNPTSEPTISPAPTSSPSASPTGTPTLTPAPTTSPQPTSEPTVSPAPTTSPTRMVLSPGVGQDSDDPDCKYYTKCVIYNPIPPRTLPDPVDDIRYIPWDELDSKVRAHAESLQYTQKLWNVPGWDNDIENLAAETIADQYDHGFDALIGMGYTSIEQWDCYINHYGDYGWSDLEEARVDQHWVALGWNRQLWDTGIGQQPITSDKFWHQLTEEEKEAATELCYMCNTWNLNSLGSDWNRNCKNEATNANAASSATTTKSCRQFLFRSMVGSGTILAMTWMMMM